jgi:RimJ/RimL family protein N-acetyltransferase
MRLIMYNNALVSFAAQTNVRSIRAMEKLGLKRDMHGDFAHPKSPADHPLSQHILYRLSEDEYLHQAQETR